MVVKLMEIYRDNAPQRGVYSLREVFVNPEHIVCLRLEPKYKRMLNEGVLPEGLDQRQEFTRVYMNRGQLGLDMVVVGAPETIEQKVRSDKRKILKG